MNDEMRNEIRREDPAAAFLTVRILWSSVSFRQCATDYDFRLSTQKRKKKGPQRPKYTGPAPPPNRFGIPPGFRWDGVGEPRSLRWVLPLRRILIESSCLQTGRPGTNPSCSRRSTSGVEGRRRPTNGVLRRCRACETCHGSRECNRSTFN